MIGQTGLNGFDFNPAAGFGLLLLIVPLLVGGLFGALAIVAAAERGTSVGPIVLALIELAPDNGEAYNLRATAYEQKGDAQSARQDRLRAEELGYSTAAASDTDEPE